MRAQFFGRFVDRESRRIGGDFEEDVAGLAVINRVEIFAIHHRAHTVAELAQLSEPVSLLRIVGRPPRDVMDASHEHAAVALLRNVEHVDQARGFRGIGGVAEPVAILGDQLEAHGVGEQG